MVVVGLGSGLWWVRWVKGIGRCGSRGWVVVCKVGLVCRRWWVRCLGVGGGG